MSKLPAEKLHLDLETFGVVDLAKCGSHRYAMDAETDVNCLGWAFNDDEPQLWIPGTPIPSRVEDHILMGRACFAWNAQFERLLFKHVLSERMGWPVISTQQWYCVMVMALAMGLPGKLEKVLPAVGIEIEKDMVGHRTMLRLCKPRKLTARNKLSRYTREAYPSMHAIQDAYCLQDVRAEQAVMKRVVPLIESQQSLYWRDQEIQDRGCTIDQVFVRNAICIIDETLLKLNAEMVEVTGGLVATVNATKQLVDWLKADGVKWPENVNPSVDKENLAKLLMRDDLTNAQRTALLLRQDAAKSSNAKLERAIKQLCSDGTVKGQLQFHGAATGRDAARGLQLQNLPRPRPKFDVESCTKDIIAGLDADWIGVIYGNPMQAVSDCLRGMIVSRPGKKLWTRDLSQIEARMTDYLSGQENMVRAYRLYDAGKGPDIYIVTASGIYNVAASSIGKDDIERQAGKVAKLSMGFGGGAGAFGAMAYQNKVDLVALFPTVWDILEPDMQEKAVEAWKMRGKSSGMRKHAWLAAEAVKLKWRDENANVVQFWRDLEVAAIDAMKRPGDTMPVGPHGIKYRKTGSWLRCVLPSGRSLFYPFPRLVKEKTPWGTSAYRIKYMAVDGMTKQWKEFSLYGGLQCQNIVQAAACDTMMEAVVRLEEAGYANILRVHDEPIFEASTGDEEEFQRLMVQQPNWAPGLPIAASGWVGERYRK